MIYGSYKTLGSLCKTENDIQGFVQKKMPFAFSYYYFSYKTIILAGIASITLCNALMAEFDIMLLVKICQNESKLVLKISLPTF